MSKYKICPECQKQNEPFRIECVYCEADLTSIRITDEKTEIITEEKADVQTESPAKMIRLCDCGAKNAPNARKCSVCNEDISDILPVPDTESTVKEFILSSIDGQYTYKVSADEVIIGRESTMNEYLAVKRYVSRSHAKISVENNELCCETGSYRNVWAAGFISCKTERNTIFRRSYRNG